MEIKDKAHHVETAVEENSNSGFNHEDRFNLARQGSILEHEMTVRTALHTYRWAIIWAADINVSVMMEGYDTLLVGSFYGYPAFQRQFGTFSKSAQSYQVAGRWQAAMGAGTQAGAIVGALFNGLLVEKFEFRPVFIGANLQTVGQVLCGVPWGIFATSGPAYASELLPLAVRPYLTSYTNMCFAIGQFIGAGILQGLVNRLDQWSYRIPFAVQRIWPPFLLVAGLLMPESPYWYVRQGRCDQAEKVMLRIISTDERHNAKAAFAMTEQTNRIEQEVADGTSYLDRFRAVDRRRTEITCAVFIAQITCGIQFAFSASYFFEQAGLNPGNAYKLSLGGTAISFLGTVTAWFLLRYVRRRVLWLSGFVVMSVCLLIVGLLTLSSSSIKGWVQAAFCLLWLAAFGITAGPIGWLTPAEVSSTRLRAKTVVLARISYYIGQTISTILKPYMINPTAWNWNGKIGLFWFGTGFITLNWGYFRLPETRGRTFEESDIMFASNVPRRKFKNYKVDAYSEGYRQYTE